MKNDHLVLALFLLLSLGGGLLIGGLLAPGEWYAGLAKPLFNPPGFVFGPVWAVLYLLIGIAGWRVWQGGELEAARLWWLQLGLNFAWAPLFFDLHAVGAALLLILALLGTILGFIGLTWRVDRPAALLFLPYAAWVAFATLLNASIWWLN